MAILSISVDKKTLTRIRKLMAENKIKSRSKFFLNTLDSFERENSLLNGLKGTVTCIISLNWKSKNNTDIRIAHNFSKHIKLDAHFDTKNGCGEVLVIEAEAEHIKKYYNSLLKSKNISKISIMIE